MATIGEKAISILAGNLNSGRSYLITAVPKIEICPEYFLVKNSQKQPQCTLKLDNLGLQTQTQTWFRKSIFLRGAKKKCENSESLDALEEAGGLILD